MTANEFVNVKDIRDIFLYTKNDHIFCYLRIYPFNLDLLSLEERQALTDRIAASFDGDRKNFDYCTLPRELDLDSYKNELKQRRLECLEQLGRKNIIDVLLQQATDLSSSHENFEHQHFFKLWIHVAASRTTAEAELKERVYMLMNIYKEAGIDCEILIEKEIIKLCNLFSNRRSASYDVIGGTLQPEIPMLKES